MNQHSAVNSCDNGTTVNRRMDGSHGVAHTGFLGTLSLLTALLVLTHVATAEPPWKHGKLMVSENARFLRHADGTPFFWLGDTGWLLFQRMNREEALMYVANRQSKGFNVIQCILLQSFADRNAYGDEAFVDNDLTRMCITPGSDPNRPEDYDYWDHVDYILDAAADHHMYLAIVPIWGQLVKRGNLTEKAAEQYAAQIAQRFRNRPNIIWVNGGSTQGDMRAEIWETLGATIKTHDPNHLMTFHPFGRTQSSTWFTNSAWLDVHMFTSGHRRYDQDDTPKAFGEDNWRYVLEDHARTPRKPTLDGEPSYEATPQGLHDSTQPYWTASDVRRYAYWSVFAGACGHTYGHNAVRQVYKRGGPKPSSGARQFFPEALEDSGASQMQHIKHLVLSRPYFERVPDQSALGGDEGDRYDRVLIARGASYMMAYTYTGREFTLQMGRISGAAVDAWWFDPRTGEALRLGTYDNAGSRVFDPPGRPANGNDWVLVLDDASQDVGPPGRAK
jgi:hypothetical protein